MRRESAADRAERARRAGKQAGEQVRAKADEMAKRAKPLTERLIARAGEAGKSLRASAEAFREGLHEGEQAPAPQPEQPPTQQQQPEPPRRRPRPGPR